MCRNITPLRGLEPPATADEVESAARQYVRKVGSVTTAGQMATPAFQEAVRKVAAATAELLAELPPRRSPPARRPPAPPPTVAGRRVQKTLYKGVFCTLIVLPIWIGASIRWASGSSPSGSSHGDPASASGQKRHLRPTLSMPIG